MSDAHCNNLTQRKALGLVSHDNTGGPFVVECHGCGVVYPSFQCNGGGQIADTGDYEDARCPHCGHVDPEECENPGLAWNTQQLKINELQQRLTAADEALDKAADEFSLMSLEAGQRMDVLEGLLRDASAWIKHNSFHGTDAIELWERIDATLKRSKPLTCTWTEGGFSWHTGCGKEWQFTDGGLPAENGMHFCHSCGKALVVDEDQPESERES